MAASRGQKSAEPPEEVPKEVFEYSPETAVTFSAENGSSELYGSAFPSRVGPKRQAGQDVIEDSIDPAVSYEKFRGKTYKSTAFDEGFYSKLGSRPVPEATEYEIVPSFSLAAKRVCGQNAQDSPMLVSNTSEHLEAPHDKLIRLKRELNEMKTVLSASDANKPYGSESAKKETPFKIGTSRSASFTDSNNCAELFHELDLLENQLESVLNEKFSTVSLQTSIDATQISKQYDAVLKKLDCMINDGVAETSALPGTAQRESQKGEVGDLKMYELFCVPSVKPLIETSRVCVMEDHLYKVEQKLGIGTLNQLPYPNLAVAIQDLSKRLSLLDQAKIDALTPKVEVFLAELESFDKSRLGITGGVSSGDDQRVTFLYQLCEQWKTAGPLLPSLLCRLVTLKSLHTEAGGIGSRLTALESEQDELASLLHSTSNNLEALQKTVNENLRWVKSTIHDFDRRIKELPK